MQNLNIDFVRKLSIAIFQLVVFTIVFCAFTSCKKNDLSKVDTIFNIDYNGQVNKIETLGYYSSADAVMFLQLANVPDKVETKCGFYLYRITYKTENFNNTEIWVSGLIAIPDSKDIRGLVSYQHGTNPERDNAPSKPSADEGLGIAALFAGDGYILLAPDYIGLGLSQETPTYLHTKSTVNAVIDFIKVGSKILSQLTKMQNSNLYLAGFSQGGCATAGVQRALEINNATGLTLKASACVAGAYNLKDISLKYAIANNSILYLGYVANSYSLIYNQSLNTIIQSNYAGLIPALYDGSKSVDFIENALPKESEMLYTPTMLNDINNGNINWFTAALEENETYRWKPVIKIKLFYGTKDIDVSPQDAISAYNYMKSIGGNAELINTGAYDHVESFLHAIPQIQQWFNNTK